MMRRPDFPLRQILASIAVVVGFCAAIIGALLGREESGLALAIATASGGTSDALQAIGDRLPLGYAFAIGMAAAVNPCGFALLTTYLGLYLGRAAGHPGTPSRAASVIGRAALVSASMTASFVGLFGAVGLVLSFASATVGAALPWLSLAAGAALLLTSGFMLGTLALAHDDYWQARPTEVNAQLSAEARRRGKLLPLDWPETPNALGWRLLQAQRSGALEQAGIEFRKYRRTGQMRPTLYRFRLRKVEQAATSQPA